MEFRRLEDRESVAKFLNRRADVHVYSLGDLTDEFWPHSRFYGAVEGDELHAICLVFSLYDPPIVLAISDDDNDALGDLVNAVVPALPDYSEIHFSPAILGAIEAHFETSSLVPHWKMAFKNRSRLEQVDTSVARRLEQGDVPALEAHFDAVYSGDHAPNVFFPSMLEVGPYFGVWEGDQIVASAGVHVYSPDQGVAAIANVATHPDFRGRGLATRAVARLVAELLRECDHIGLNVAQGNAAAISAYRRVGFEVVADYYEGYISRRD